MLAFSQRLGCLLIASAVLAASGARKQLAARRHASRGLGAQSAAQRFALSRARIKDLCTDEVSAQACEVLGAAPGASATAAQLAAILAAGGDEVAALLKSIGLGGGEPFECRTFCEAAASNIPEILSTAAPTKAGLGCIDAACHLEQVDVSADALAEEGLEAPPPVMGGEDLLELQPGMNASREEVSPEVRARLLFRMALNVVLGIFPAVDEIDGEEPERSLLQRASEEGPDGGSGVSFGSDVPLMRHFQYREYVMKASAWIAGALRRLRSGRSYIKKWFILTDESEVDAQEDEARDHLTRMLQLMSNIVIRQGTPSFPCKRDGETGTLAYMYRIQTCKVQSRRDCSERDKSGRYVVSVCDFFWQRNIKRDMRVRTIVHESSHHFGTDDLGYCSLVDCLALSSEQARDNADSYAEFVKDLVTAEGME